MSSTTSARRETSAYLEFVALVRASTGIVLGEDKRPLLEARLKPLATAAGHPQLDDYLAHLFLRASPAERTAALDQVTTNTTSFFREAHHFELLQQLIVPERLERRRPDVFRIWSAACSTGEEPYSVAMALAALGARRPLPPARILATDISARVLEQARSASYPAERLQSLPAEARAAYLVAPPEPGQRVTLRPEIARMVSFHRLNLVEGSWRMKHRFEVIFCRNVLIYFDDETRRRVVRRLVEQLLPGGFLILGHSDNALSRSLPLEAVGPTAYRLRASEGA